MQETSIKDTVHGYVDLDHHKNGDWRDNRAYNLRFLCPNCHSQTPNFGTKNRRD